MDRSTKSGENSCAFDRAVLENVAGLSGNGEGSECWDYPVVIEYKVK